MESPPLGAPNSRRGRPAGRLNGGRTPTGLYAHLRKHVAAIYALESGASDMSHRQFAASLGLANTTCYRLRQFVREHDNLVEQAIASNDWSAVEQEMFGRFGSGFRFLRGYRQAIELIEAGEAGTNLGAPRRPRRRSASPRQEGAEQAAPVPAETTAPATPPVVPSPAVEVATPVSKPTASAQPPDDLFGDIPVLTRAGAIAAQQQKR